MSTQYDDPFDAAENAQVRGRNVFGQLTLTSWFCVLEKGIGKAPFDPAVHKPEQRRTGIRIEIKPLASSGMQWDVMRELIAESQSWTKIVLPSLKALDLPLKGLTGRWVQVELVPTGRKWLDAAGEEHAETMPRFVAVYGSEAECEAAAGASASPEEQAAAGTPAGGNGNGAKPAPAAQASSAAPSYERTAAAAFLKPLWEKTGHDEGKFLATIKANGVLSKHFDATSPEVLALTAVPF